jgi:hypothetical protein
MTEGNPRAVLFDRIAVSPGLIPAALTATTTSPAARVGIGASAT